MICQYNLFTIDITDGDCKRVERGRVIQTQILTSQYFSAIVADNSFFDNHLNNDCSFRIKQQFITYQIVIDLLIED